MARKPLHLVLPVGQAPAKKTIRLVVNTEGFLIYDSGQASQWHVDDTRVMKDQPHRIYGFDFAMKADFTVLAERIEGRSFETHGARAYRIELLIHDGTIAAHGGTPPDDATSDMWCCCRRYTGQSSWTTFNCAEHFGEEVLDLPFPGLIAFNEKDARIRLAEKLASLKLAA
ncbi:hypothetical protein [uncultured Salinicola sp.]|mgnify:CR=1 FL=1|uniref:hypothetical protein n=1 Tax=uncultured Salinicola sp. TaxID=1193542 RepID=UPI00262E2E50|nr:hypothetical protein [uncultured Salinicola sp.]|tara:strand:+ start:2716 stop:3228 length:513 start_codon:yes stop_codon:yes gene_type:complete